MALFDRDAEALRKENLKKLEDKRLAFAERMQKEGFRPERMLLSSDETGSYTAVARVDNKVAVIAAPRFGDDADFEMWLLDHPVIEREEIFEKGTGLNGAFGFGKKGASGFIIHIHVDDTRVVDLSVVAGRTAATEFTKYSKNTLLSTKRRRGDANVVWDFMPLEMSKERKAREAIDNYYLEGC